MTIGFYDLAAICAAKAANALTYDVLSCRDDL